MKNVVLLAPTVGNGGIASWAKKYTTTYNTEDFRLISVPIIKKGKNPDAGIFERIRLGLSEVGWIINNLKKLTTSEKIDILHTTTSGSLGTYRDYRVAKFCQQHNIKSILHCHYGSMSDHFKNPYARRLLLKTFKLYDQIWVLDRKTFDLLTAYSEIAHKIKLTPNPIIVNSLEEIETKSYNNFAFIGNVIPQKGIIDLVKAFKKTKFSAVLHIVGPAQAEIIKQIEEISGSLWNNRIKYIGLLPNDQAVAYMDKIDVLVLPTYYPHEAFPISILEAMSKGKLVISTPRAAIPDMLSMPDGTKCGLLIPEQDIAKLSSALKWITDNKNLADDMCRNAYIKVLTSYSSDIVYKIYTSLYTEVLH